MTLGLIGTGDWTGLVTHACHYRGAMAAGITPHRLISTLATKNNKEQKKTHTDGLIKLLWQLVQANCPNKSGLFRVNSLNEFHRVIWLHLHKWVSAHSVHVTRWSPITPRSISIEPNYTVFHLPCVRSIMWDWQKTEHLLRIGNHVTKK